VLRINEHFDAAGDARLSLDEPCSFDIRFAAPMILKALRLVLVPLHSDFDRLNPISK